MTSTPATSASVVSRSISLSLSAPAASQTVSSTSRGLSSRSVDAPDGISLPESAAIPDGPSITFPPSNSASPSAGVSTMSHSTATAVKPSASLPVKNPAGPAVSESSTSDRAEPTSTARGPAPPAASPDTSTRRSSAPAEPTTTRPASSTPRTSGQTLPVRTSSNTPPTSTSTIDVAGAIGQASSTTSAVRHMITRTITDVPESTFSRPVSVTVTDSINGETSVAAPPFVTILSTSTEPDGSSITFTHVIANPTGFDSNNSALSNQSVLDDRGAAAGIFVSVGLVAALIAGAIFVLCRRRRRRLRREQWLDGIQNPRPPSDPFTDPPMIGVNIHSDNTTRSAAGRNLLDDEVRSSISAGHQQPMFSQLHTGGASNRVGDNPFGDNVHPHTNIGLAITSDHYASLHRQSRLSLAPSTPSMYPASLPPSDRDADSVYEQESSITHLNPNTLAAPQPVQPAVKPLLTRIPVPPHPPPQVPPRSLSRPKSAKLSDYNPFGTPPSSVSSHSKPATPTDDHGRPLVHIWDDRTVTPPEPEQMYAKNPAEILTRRTLLDVRPKVNRDTFGGVLS
ncbi:hypothetical protein AB1N83_005385 [Pleurotus pulmonarius]